MNKELADFNISGPSMKLTEAKIKRHIYDNAMPSYDPENNICARSMNSEAFSHFSLPSNNLMNGLKIMPQNLLSIPSTLVRYRVTIGHKIAR